ncbi:MAG: TrmJ/YjtD family RNA methyltransferase [Candidatus Altiarchaeota archaeon]|nr:TrmJ/YjtD family RNA methyltransferase [Candidatus Altiarchaeota archaeon]
MYVVLVGIEYEGNLGMIARLCENFDAKLILVNPKAKINAESKKWARHAAKVLENAKIYDNLDDVKRDVKLLVGTSSETANQYNVNRSFILPHEVKRVSNMGLVFGRESIGLKNEEINACDILVTIPTSKKYESLNISNAVAIMLYELNRRSVKKQLASRVLRDKALQFWEELLVETNHTKDKIRIQKTMFKRVIEKANLNEREGHGVTGILSKILKRIKNLKQ